MTKVLQDIWILSEGGIVLYHRIYDENIDEQLLGALMSALTSFAEEIVDDGLSNFEMQNIKFTLFKKRGLLFIAKSSKKVNEKKVSDELNKIADKFLEIYSDEELKSWDGESVRFSNFEKEIEESLEDTIKKFQNAFW